MLQTAWESSPGSWALREPGCHHNGKKPSWKRGFVRTIIQHPCLRHDPKGPGKARMLKKIQICLCFFFVLGILYEISLLSGCFFSYMPMSKHFLTPEQVLNLGKSIIFLETTERLEPPPLVSCSVESAARIYQDRPIILFMKGLTNDTVLDLNSSYTAFSLLSSMKNVFIFPLQMETVFQETPLLQWYNKVVPKQEKNWVHVSSDASRLALIWKYGGIYMDTDVISIRPIPEESFLAAQKSQFSSNGIFGFPAHHKFIWDCMENFVLKYNGNIWGNQGPFLMTRMLKAICNLTDFKGTEDHSCQNISFLNPQRFYPIPYPAWGQYYEVWEKNPNFNHSYALHLWNFMNHNRKAVVAGSNTLAEKLYKAYCPTTYKDLIQNAELRGFTSSGGAA
ncbi:alpha-1,4-N-acetylglucosaminyltransferase [Accipiter gentilis]|uniref:alpha-1,4-N-acetylglucosaminyltransferase n=1 Tax=Astur gentilis TaxID=8957 RepID=UPI00210FB1EB|nr:alpha-1,4-N-acetylglucosaminyltransferase [Accipiter gentilis]